MDEIEPRELQEQQLVLTDLTIFEHSVGFICALSAAMILGVLIGWMCRGMRKKTQREWYI